MTFTLAPVRLGQRWAPVVLAGAVLGAGAAVALWNGGSHTGALPFAVAGAPAPPLRARAGHLEVTLLPPQPRIPVGVMQEWAVLVRDGAGAPRSGLRLAIDGEMPDHGHGLPTSPRIRATDEPGRYRLEGLRFSMPGYWRLVISVAGDGGGDAAFDLTLAP